MKRLLLICLLLMTPLSFVQASEQEVLMVRSNLTFPDAMSVLQNAIIDHHYTLSRVQRIDVGLEKAGYTTDRYRIVFYGKHDQIKEMSDKYPELAAYLPLKIALFSEENNTLMVALNPLMFSEVVADPALRPVFRQWLKDVKSIMSVVASEE